MKKVWPVLLWSILSACSEEKPKIPQGGEPNADALPKTPETPKTPEIPKNPATARKTDNCEKNDQLGCLELGTYRQSYTIGGVNISTKETLGLSDQILFPKLEKRLFTLDWFDNRNLYDYINNDNTFIFLYKDPSSYLFSKGLATRYSDVSLGTWKVKVVIPIEIKFTQRFSNEAFSRCLHFIGEGEVSSSKGIENKYFMKDFSYALHEKCETLEEKLFELKAQKPEEAQIVTPRPSKYPLEGKTLTFESWIPHRIPNMINGNIQITSHQGFEVKGRLTRKVSYLYNNNVDLYSEYEVPVSGYFEGNSFWFEEDSNQGSLLQGKEMHCLKAKYNIKFMGNQDFEGNTWGQSPCDINPAIKGNIF